MKCELSGDTDKRLREDFCESFALFMTDPYRLQQSSSKRYSLMMGLVRKYYSQDQRDFLAQALKMEYDMEVERYKQNGASPVKLFNPEDYRTPKDDIPQSPS